MLIFSRYTWWLAAMVGLALLLAVLSGTGIISPFQGVFLRVASPFEGGLTAVFNPIASFFSEIGNVNGLRNENAQLRLENEALQNKMAALQQESQQIAELKQALHIQQTSGAAVKVAASVVAHDTSPFTDVISIDKGDSSGIRPGMTVLSADGTLMGTVMTTTSHASFVRLLPDSQSKVAARTVESSAEGIVEGGPNRTLTFNLSRQAVKVGDTVVTSGLGGNYPPNIPIGQVTSVSGTAQDLFRTVTVAPMVRLTTVTTVLVDTSFVPQTFQLQTSSP